MAAHVLYRSTHFVQNLPFPGTFELVHRALTEGNNLVLSVHKIADALIISRPLSWRYSLAFGALIYDNSHNPAIRLKEYKCKRD